MHWYFGEPLKNRTGKLSQHRMKPTRYIRILIFDVDGVLIDVRETFWRSAVQTVRHLSGRKVTFRELQQWKSRPGYNDDWQMTADWVTQLGRPTTYEEARAAFNQFYWGTKDRPGNVRKEKWNVSAKQISRWAGSYELNIFTGRNRREFDYTFAGWPARRHLRTVITMDDVERKKPFPDGLLKILGKRDPAGALYVGDNVDDAMAAQAAGVPFFAILPRSAFRYRERAERFRSLGALKILERTAGLSRWLPGR